MKKYKDGEIVEPLFGIDLNKKFPFYENVYYTVKWKLIDLFYFTKKIYQSVRYGFPLEQSYNFYSFCSKWSIPRLKHLRNNLHGHPTTLTLNEWKDILDKIIWSMENYQNEPDPIYPPNYDHRHIVSLQENDIISFKRIDEREVDFSPIVEHDKKCREGFELFGKYFMDLWD